MAACLSTHSHSLYSRLATIPLIPAQIVAHSSQKFNHCWGDYKVHSLSFTENIGVEVKASKPRQRVQNVKVNRANKGPRLSKRAQKGPRVTSPDQTTIHPESNNADAITNVNVAEWLEQPKPSFKERVKGLPKSDNVEDLRPGFSDYKPGFLERLFGRPRRSQTASKPLPEQDFRGTPFGKLAESVEQASSPEGLARLREQGRQQVEQFKANPDYTCQPATMKGYEKVHRCTHRSGTD